MPAESWREHWLSDTADHFMATGRTGWGARPAGVAMFGWEAWPTLPDSLECATEIRFTARFDGSDQVFVASRPVVPGSEIWHRIHPEPEQQRDRKGLSPVARFNLAMRWVLLAGAIVLTSLVAHYLLLPHPSDWTVGLVLPLYYCAVTADFLACRKFYGTSTRSRPTALMLSGRICCWFAANFSARPERDRVEVWLAAITGGCRHPDAEPVDLLLTGERVAWLCPACDARLPKEWA